MKTASILVAFAASVLQPRLAAQDTLPPDEIVRRIVASGSISSVTVGFYGCPQTDEHGRRVFEAITAADIPLTAVVQLPTSWGRAYLDCDYGPLEDWFDRGLETVLRSGNSGAVRSFIVRLPTDAVPTPRMRQSLWTAAASGAYQGEILDLIADEAVESANPAERVSMTIEAFTNRSVTSNWIYAHAGYLTNEYPSLYLPALARVTSGLPSDRLEIVLTSLHSYVRAGRVNPRAQGLDAIRASVRTRQGLPLHLRSLEPTD